MATNLPWSVKGIDADTREAARDAARRAGMTVSDWLEHVIREEARRAEPEVRHASTPDIQSRLQRLDLERPDPGRHDPGKQDTGRLDTGRLGQSGSRSAMERSSAAARADASRHGDLDALLNHAAQLESRTRDTESKTTSAIESIVGWIEKAESRMAAAERAAAERQERATSVIADAIKTVSSRVADVERRAQEPAHQPAHQPAHETAEAQLSARSLTERGAAMSRPGILSRETLAHAISDIQVRQRELDRTQTRQQPAMAGHRLHDERAGRDGHEERRNGERRADVTPLMNVIRADLAQLRTDIASLSAAPASSRLEESIRELGQKLDQRLEQRLEKRPATFAMDELSRPLARIEAELGKLQSLDKGDRFSRIETEIHKLGSRIEELARSAHEPKLLAAAVHELTSLKDALSRDSAVPRIEDLSGQISALAQDISRVRDEMSRTSPTGDVENAIEDMRASLMRETREANGIGHGLLQRIMHQLDVVATAMQNVPANAMGETDRTQFSLLSQKLDHLAQRTQPESLELARSIEALAIKLDDMSGRGSDELAQRVERLSAQIDHLSARGPAAIEKQIDMLAARIEALAKAQQPAVPTAAPAQIDLTPIEDMIGDLTRRIEDVSRPDSSAQGLQSLERQIAALAQRLDAKPHTTTATDGLENTLQDLMRYLGGLREETTTAVDRAARAAVADAISHVARPAADPEHLSLLRDDLAGLKDVHVSIDKRTHNAIGAVNDTLEKIVQRLAQLEDDISRDRSEEMNTSARLRTMAAREPDSSPDLRESGRREAAMMRTPDSKASQPVAQPISQSSAPSSASDKLFAAREAARQIRPSDVSESTHVPSHVVARRIEESILEPEPDVPLEPGSGRPRGRSEAGMGTSGTQGSAINPNLIAAARRAAMAASSEADALGTDGKKSGKGKAARTSLPISLRETLEKRRKPILLGLAAVVLALGAGQIASSLLTDAPAPQQVRSAAEAEAARKPAAPVIGQRSQSVTPEAPAGEATQPSASTPPKDQTSMSRPDAPAKADASGQITGSVASAPAVAQVPVLQAPVDMASLAPPAADPFPSGRFTAEPGRVTDLGELPSTIGTPGLRRAALEGDANAVYELGVRAGDGIGMARDAKLAMRLFERAAAAGSAPAQFRLANIFEKGIGTARDAKLATNWYKRAADKGNAKAMHNLAVLIAEGADGRPDYAAAASLFRQAAEFGIRDSQFNLAILLGRGLGLEQDMTQSYTWFAIAARQGDNDAAKKRDEVGARLTPVDLAAGRSASLNWKPKTVDPVANEASAPPDGWDPQPKPAKPQSKQRVS